jgi:hypothetical protein
MHLRKTKLDEDSRLCSLCSKNDSYFLLSVGNLCSECFIKRYGEVTLAKDSAEYYGGDNAHVIAGRFRKHESGHLYLTENYLIFTK